MGSVGESDDCFDKYPSGGGSAPFGRQEERHREPDSACSEQCPVTPIGQWENVSEASTSRRAPTASRKHRTALELLDGSSSSASIALIGIGSLCLLGSFLVAWPALAALAHLGFSEVDLSNTRISSPANSDAVVIAPKQTASTYPTGSTAGGMGADADLRLATSIYLSDKQPSERPPHPPHLPPPCPPPTPSPPRKYGCASSFYQLMNGHYDCAMYPLDDVRRCASQMWGPTRYTGSACIS